MSDRQIRELERRWQASRTLEDEVAYLRARRQAGNLSDQHLGLLAALGDPAAIDLVGEVDWHDEPADPLERLRLHVAGLSRWGVEAPLQVALACCELFMERARSAAEQLKPHIPATDQAHVAGRTETILGEVEGLLQEAREFMARGAGDPLPPWSGNEPRLDPVAEGLHDGTKSFFGMTAIDELMRMASALGSAVRAPNELWDPEPLRAELRDRQPPPPGVFVSYAPPDPLDLQPPHSMTHRSRACAEAVKRVARGLTSPGWLFVPYRDVPGYDLDHGVWLARDTSTVVERLRTVARTRIRTLIGLAVVDGPVPTPHSENVRRAEQIERTSDPLQLAALIKGLELDVAPEQIAWAEALVLRHLDHEQAVVRRAAALVLTRGETPSAHAALKARLLDPKEDPEVQLRALAWLARRGPEWLEALPELLVSYSDSALSLVAEACGGNRGERLNAVLSRARMSWFTLQQGDLKPAQIPTEDVVAVLCAREQHVKQEARRFLVDVLCVLGSPPTCQPLLRRIACDPCEPQDARIAAIKDLLADEVGRAQILKLSGDPDGGVQRTAIGRFDALPTADAEQQAAALLTTTTDSFTHNALLRFLEEHGSPAAAPALQQFVARAELSERVRDRAQALLARLG